MAKKVMVAMSGGVDSSVAAALLLEQGYEVLGATFRLFSDEDIGRGSVSSRACCSLEDVEDARSVAYKLGFEHFVFNFSECFREEVIGRFAEVYRKGETPNPCIDCNRAIKFDRFLQRALALDIDYIATGHYARREFDPRSGRFVLRKAKGRTKDQTYVLYAMTQTALERTLFPLGELTKNEVRALAEARGLVNAGKPDSQDICFVRDGSYAAFLENVLGVPSSPGRITDAAGRGLGEHKGLLRYTIGQRKGLNLGLPCTQYVLRKDPTSNTLVVGDERELYQSGMTVGNVNLIAVKALSAPVPAGVKIRYSQKEAPAMLYPREDGLIGVRFEEPQRAVTPGQAAVFYQGDTVLGGGTILSQQSAI